MRGVTRTSVEAQRRNCLGVKKHFTEKEGARHGSTDLTHQHIAVFNIGFGEL